MAYEKATAQQVTASVFEAFRAFIRQKPCIDPRNYYSDWRDKDGVRVYRSECRSIQTDGRRARKALELAEAYPFSSTAILEACGAYSGRLQVVVTPSGKLALEYCTGQYFATEYRKAAAAVLECYVDLVRPKHSPGGKVPRNTDELQRMAKDAGSHFFDRDTMRFFASRVEPEVYTGPGGVYFVTSEKGGFNCPDRVFTVRTFDVETGDISTFGEMGEWTRAGAKQRAFLASLRTPAWCYQCGGTGQKHTRDCWMCKGTGNIPVQADSSAA